MRVLQEAVTKMELNGSGETLVKNKGRKAEKGKNLQTICRPDTPEGEEEGRETG